MQKAAYLNRVTVGKGGYTMSKYKGGFTLPGEAGYEKLTLKMAEKWGADVIRDSDGTALSDEILQAGYGIYSTICIIRDHNEWAKKNLDKLQQTFLMTEPVVAVSDHLQIELMKDFFADQFQVNEREESLKYWQVYDRTTDQLVARENWKYDAEEKTVEIFNAVAFHKYTVSFMAYRIWEEISMYNHTTNHWEKEHLMQIDPRYEETRIYMKQWMKQWCEEHPATTVVRFTSMFYNFVWIWGSDERNRNLYSDWASYDFTVSPKALDEFAEKYGYTLTAEDFINQGKLHVTHANATKQKRDWMEFINDFVISFGKELIDIVHAYGKEAYVFYDDSWVGIEPYNGRFEEFGFDGLIKCVFSGYEARLCAGVPVKTHELRLHPYLFPVGLGGAPTFMEGGNPTMDAKKYWNSVRRALLREPIDRLGLGGYLHLTEDFQDFQDYIEEVTDEFRMIKQFHKAGKAYCMRPKVAVLHYWGKLRSWTLSGHFHETYMHDLIHINEALSGLPLDVKFISFEDVKNGALQDVDVVINAGYARSAWSGHDAWKDEELVTILTKWVYEGGVFLGVNEPSAVEGYDHYFRMSHVLGIDEDDGDRVCHGKWSFTQETVEGLFPEGMSMQKKEKRYLTDKNTKVLYADGTDPIITVHDFGQGKGVYLAEFKNSLANTRFLMNLILYACNEDLDQNYLTDSSETECAYYPESQMLVVINNSETSRVAKIRTEKGMVSQKLDAYETKMIDLKEYKNRTI